jgi:pimeloyl-ACP methyl ester carboxylesterase
VTEDEPVSEGRSIATFGVPAGALALLDWPPFERWARIGLRLFLEPDTFTDLQRTAYYDAAAVTPEVAAGYQQQLQVTGWDEAMLDIVRGPGFADPPLEPTQVAAIEVPTLVIWGEQDTWVPFERGQVFIETLLNDPQVLIYEQTGHMPMEEQPQQFNRALFDFLKEANTR